VIQGHRNLELRRKCAEGLLEIGFDGYGLGGWLFDERGKLDWEMLETNARLTPDEFPRYALGFGKPADVKKLYRFGYDIFDCVLPTRDARHGRIYLLDEGESESESLHLRQGKYAFDKRPLEVGCDCPACRRYTRSYLHHLLKVGDSTFYRLATLHNLRCYSRLCQRLGK
jgi:queuine tRNA-ribosyltransferase